eukprot:Blabericola_migrator_1__3221@NODE_1948_length_3518_cov_491_752246_g72_i2_p2_GENE_NODE_1948_length_3518_cov_491_752246_g72_i2NODE_1948_length_3518_cov_491_752246_g72_i2_p2_ORF_typecomplete_len173_score31_23_NODE_1948_length_3518_cov_491_752246_g72_i227693287
MHAQWDPIEGSINLEFYERRDRVRWRLRREQFKAIPWNFFEAMIVCLREMSIWKAVNEEVVMMRARKQQIMMEAKLKRLRDAQHDSSAKSGISSTLTPQIVGRSNQRNRSTAYAAPRVERIMSAVRKARIETALKKEEQLKRSSTGRLSVSESFGSHFFPLTKAMLIDFAVA